jgi:hypothetical protein
MAFPLPADVFDASVDAAAARRAAAKASSDTAFPVGLRIRCDVAVHIALRVAPRPALLSKLARLIADEVELLGAIVWRRYALLRLERREREGGEAQRREIAAERAALPPPPDALAVTAAACRLAVVNFFSECLAAGLGTFVLPGWGTYAGSALGEAIGSVLIS